MTDVPVLFGWMKRKGGRLLSARFCEHVDHLTEAAFFRVRQRGDPVGICQIHVRAVFDQKLDDFYMTAISRRDEGGAAKTVGNRRIGTCGNTCPAAYFTVSLAWDLPAQSPTGVTA